MNLLERYLQAVGQYLSAATREDTLAELMANLLEQMDARTEELGRPLTEAETANVLRTHGRPETVAARYLPQRSLIGPGIFPSYELTLRKALPFVIFIYAIVKGIGLVAASSRQTLADDLVQAILGLVPTLLLFWACITLVFAGIEFAHTRYGAGQSWGGASTWDPTKLPPLKPDAGATRQRSLASRIADLVFHCLWMVYVLAIPAHPFLMLGPGVYLLDSLGIRFAPIWHTFFVCVILLLVVQLVMKVLAVASQNHPALKILSFSTNVISIVTFSIIAFAGEFFVPNATTNLQKLAIVNHSMEIAFRIALLIAIIGFIIEGWKSFKRFIPTERLAF